MSIEEATAKIMALVPTEQLRLEILPHIRQQVHLVILTHTGELQDKINDLDRQLYIANRKIENAREEEVDSAGFNK